MPDTGGVVVLMAIMIVLLRNSLEITMTKHLDTKNLRTIITGAGRGIGAAITEEFLKRDHPIVGIDRSWSIHQQGENIISITADISEENFWKNTFLNLLDSFQPNILINNAGIQFEASFLETTTEIFEQTWRTNVATPLFLSQAAVQFWIKHKILGTIVNLSSIHDTIPSGIPSYSSSKAALGMLTKEIALAVSSYGIRAFCVAPGSVDTPLNAKDLDTPEKLKQAKKAIPLGRLCKTSEVARLIYMLVEDCPYLTGSTIILDGGLSLKR